MCVERWQRARSAGTFNQASDELDHYYSESLAQRVNKWAAADLAEFGYKPWKPGMGIATRLGTLEVTTTGRL